MLLLLVHIVLFMRMTVLMRLFHSRHVPSARSDGNAQNASQYRSFPRSLFFVSLVVMRAHHLSVTLVMVYLSPIIGYTCCNGVLVVTFTTLLSNDFESSLNEAKYS